MGLGVRWRWLYSSSIITPVKGLLVQFSQGYQCLMDYQQKSQAKDTNSFNVDKGYGLLYGMVTKAVFSLKEQISWVCYSMNQVP